MSRRIGSVAILAALAVTTFHAHQQTPQQPALRSRVDVVHLDVSVLDKNRKPVRGLTAADFTVLEDNKPQPVSVFQAIDVPPPAPMPAAKWARDVTPDVQTNEAVEQPEGRLFVILIDDAMLPGDPAAVRNAKKIARGIVDRMGPVDQAAVVYTFASKNSQGFTRDRTKLLNAIDGFVMGAASYLLGWDTPLLRNPRDPLTMYPTVDSDTHLRTGAMQTLQLVADTLIKAPQRRKALMYVSPGIGVDHASGAQPVRNTREGDPYRAAREANHELVKRNSKVFLDLARANVTVYSIDPCGLDGLAGYVLGAASSLYALRVATTPVPPDYNWLAPSRPPRPADLVKHVAEVNMDFLVAAAANTGGRTIVNTNDFDPGLDEIFEENRSYYLIGYAKPTQTPPGHLHRIKVQVNRPEVMVRTRTGYEVERPDPPATDPSLSAMANAGAGPVASSGMPLAVTLAPFAVAPGPDGQTAAVTIALELRQPMVAARTPQTINLQTALFTPDGIRVGVPVRQTLQFTLVPGPGEVIRYDALTQLPAKPGRYEVRIAAHRASDGATGSVYADVVVPDFSKNAVSLSGVWIAAAGSTGVPRDALARILPIVPTSSRTFARTDDVAAHFRVYQGGDRPLTAVPLSVRIVNDRDETIASSKGEIALERFNASTRAADHRFALPLRGLEPGRYLFTFEVALGEATARRDVIVTVR